MINEYIAKLICMRVVVVGGCGGASDEGDAVLGVVLPLEPVIKADEDLGHINFLHDPQVVYFQVLGVVSDVIPDEGVHEFDQFLQGRLLDDGGTIILVDCVLQQQDEQDENLLELPGVVLQGFRHFLEKLGEPNSDADSHVLKVRCAGLILDELIHAFECLHVLPDERVDVLGSPDFPQVLEYLLEPRIVDTVSLELLFLGLWLRVLPIMRCFVLHRLLSFGWRPSPPPSFLFGFLYGAGRLHKISTTTPLCFCLMCVKTAALLR